MAFITNLLLSSKIGGLFKVAVRPTDKRLKSIQKGLKPANILPIFAKALTATNFLLHPETLVTKYRANCPVKAQKPWSTKMLQGQK